MSNRRKLDRVKLPVRVDAVLAHNAKAEKPLPTDRRSRRQMRRSVAVISLLHTHDEDGKRV